MTEDPKSVQTAVRAAIAGIEVPGGGALGDFSGLSEIIVTKSAVALALTVAPGMERAFAPVRAAVEAAIAGAAPGRKPMVTLTAAKPPSGPGGANRPAPPQRAPVPGIRHVVAVGSGKGGVGKSTTSVNLALALAVRGLRIGVLDADLYGPSLPRLLGLEGKPALRDDGIFRPFEAYGLKAMSIGAMLEKNQAVVWRGPMASAALRQLLRDTDWGELDILVVDLPPGTGDIQLSLAQQVDLAGAVIVSTPQDLALIDARKAIDMFGKVSVPVLGVVENMSYFVAPDTGRRYDIFGHGGARQAAAELDLPFFGEIPLVMAIREGSDAGRPVVAVDPKSPDAQAFEPIARALAERLGLAGN